MARHSVQLYVERGSGMTASAARWSRDRTVLRTIHQGPPPSRPVNFSVRMPDTSSSIQLDAFACHSVTSWKDLLPFVPTQRTFMMDVGVFQSERVKYINQVVVMSSECRRKSLVSVSDIFRHYVHHSFSLGSTVDSLIVSSSSTCSGYNSVHLVKTTPSLDKESFLVRRFISPSAMVNWFS